MSSVTLLLPAPPRRGHELSFPEGSGKRRLIAESAQVSDLREGLLRLGQECPGPGEAQPDQILMGRYPKGMAETA